MLLDQIEISRAKAGGSAQEDIFIVLPHHTQRMKWFARHLTGTAILDKMFPRFDAITPDGDFSTDGTVLFNLDGVAPATAQSQGENYAAMACNRLKWSIQAQAGSATQFYLRVKFYDV